MINSKRIAKNFLQSNILPIKIRLNQLSHVRHEMIWVVVGQILAFLGAFAGIKILTTVMQPEGYGQLALGITIAGLLNMFIYGPVGQVVARFFSVCHEKNELRVYFFILKKAHIACGLMLLVFICLAAILTNVWAGGKWALLVIMASLFGIVSGINVSFLSLQGAIRQRKVVALHQGIDAWLRPALAIAALYLFRNSVYFALLGYILGTFTITLSQWVFAMKNTAVKEHWNGTSPDKKVVRANIQEFYAYANPFILWAGIAAVSMYADRWILQGLFGTEEVGVYVAIYQIANAPIALLVGMITQFILPIIFERAGVLTSAAQAESSARLLNQTVIVSVIIILPIIAVTFFFSESLVGLLTSSVFTEHHRVLWVITLGLVLYNVGQLLVSKGLYCNQPQIYIWPKAIQGGSFLILAYFLAKHLGIPGLAVALCGSSLLYLTVILLVNRRLSERLNNKKTEDLD